MRTDDLVNFIKAREELRKTKETNDPILSKYRFCNVRRNDDRVTKWIHENWMFPHKTEADLWFAMVVARLFNLPSTLEVLAPTVFPTFKPEAMRLTLFRKKQNGPIFNGAYIVSTNGIPMDKVDYLVDRVLKPLWKARGRLRPVKSDSLDIYHMALCKHQGLGSFMAAQVIADIKYVKPLMEANDWTWWAASGPGSRRGLGRVMHDSFKHTYNETLWRMEFHNLWVDVNKKLKWRDVLTGQDLQNCLCEFDKYERARLGEGVPKQLYKERVNG